MSTGKEKKKWNYFYHYPEQVVLFKELESTDISLIARKIGLTRQYIYMMARGVRKIHPEVKILAEKLTSLRKEMQNL